MNSVVDKLKKLWAPTDEHIDIDKVKFPALLIENESVIVDDDMQVFGTSRV